MPRKSRDELSTYSARKRAATWLRSVLGPGEPVRSKDLKAWAVQGHFCWRTLERARAELGVRAIRIGEPSQW